VLAITVGAQPSEIHQMPPKLQAEILPWFAARDGKDGVSPFTRKTLEGLVAPQIKRVALVYFATWCLPCREGVLRLKEQKGELQKNGVLVVLVNVGEQDMGVVQKWVRQFGTEQWPLISDQFGRLTEGFGLVKPEEKITLPRTIVLSEKLKPLQLIGAEGSDWSEILWR
jgi:alkyl hydroperoxide reductase subunit AhpC